MPRSIIEPFKIKMVEPLNFRTCAQREKILQEAGYNLFCVQGHDVTFDFLTDSGTAAMSANQWGAMMVADEVYAGSQSFQKFRQAVQDIMGFEHVIPTHQGRAAERIFFGHLVQAGHKIPSNNHFDTTRANIEALGAEAVDLVIAEGTDPQNHHPFKGNMDLERLEAFCREHRAQIPLGMITITNNTGGGQPVSLENLAQVARIYRSYGIPFIIDACRFAENSILIQKREPGQKDKPITTIVQEIFSLADGCLMSGKKDALANIGGFIALKDDRWVQSLKDLLILTEGFPTYGGLAARDMEAMAIGLREVLDPAYLEYRIAVSRYMVEKLNAIGIPTVQPAGGHAVYIDTKSFLPHIPKHEYPGQALAVELYRREGLRTCEIGSVMFKDAKMELVRLAFPRRVYTQSHIDYIIEGMAEMVPVRHEIRGLRIVYDPPVLRHFSARFEPLEGSQERQKNEALRAEEKAAAEL
jgi:tryptophanase